MSADSYGLLILLILGTYALAVSTSGSWSASAVLFAQIGTVELALRTSKVRRGMRLAAAVLLALAGIGAVVKLFVEGNAGLEVFVALAGGVLYFIAPFSIARHIAFRPTVDRETMLGAVAAYLCIGIAFALIYQAFGAIQASPFFGPQGDGTISDDLFFSFVTLTTTGYGNLVPSQNPGQSLAVMEALVGQLFLVTAVAKIVTAWRPRGWSERPATPQGSEPAES
jgi:ion channel